MLHGIVYLCPSGVPSASGEFELFIFAMLLFTLTTHPSGQFAHELVLLGSVGIDVVAKP